MPYLKPVPAKPLPGQESVWDFPRPAIAHPVSCLLRAVFDGHVLAETTNGVRTIETSHPPTYYFPPADVDLRLLQPNGRRSLCEWKGEASYFDVVTANRRAAAAAWTYPQPVAAFASLLNFIAFYPAEMDACFVDGELAKPQAGGFYGGWITSKFAGPFKGEPNSYGW